MAFPIAGRCWRWRRDPCRPGRRDLPPAAAQRHREKRAHSESLCLGGKRIKWRTLGRPKGEFAPPKLPYLFGRGSVSIT